MINLETPKETAQDRFSRIYISSAEIQKKLELTRSALLYARKTGKLPGAIDVSEGRIFVWERETIQPYLDAWQMVLNARRGG